ncbi:MAG: bifunctional [glutamine synthetase] adenylyltransferase/[glutamine synthetase]-adenylyl-L-tyrosine phosphorylase [Rhodospirillales bacterium]|nr:bifunctional [glutamine synthetase] adenylyltransferase/[glutamine synthetase]-adenylyl-L-tyrosine phosphorylase [Rhodospirillales bacterium]MDH3966679.1 bifunctional [glutamine synthetase] adenylyltransferase/[glutamine synthetase]-adenylyl-L-tyrosine phosphorylase [Rhodospirillales bacterium]
MTQDLFFLSVTDPLPKVNDPARAALGLQHWEERTARLDDSALAAFARELAEGPAGRRLLEALFANSPFLTHCVLTDIGFLARLLKQGPEAGLNEVLAGLKGEPGREPDKARLMTVLRVARRRVALTVALADITASWPLERITEALTAFADAALSATLCHLLLAASKRGNLALADGADPERACGYAVLGMGKYGARELNYSSDIDLIVIFDPETADYRGRLSPQEAFVRMTRDLVAILEERTGDGYVHRVDLRLRPDPGAMPLAISYTAAMTYYESMGQNWERAAMIKARPVAGDLALGAALLAELKPFVWRKHLDFWAIEDVHSIKRQIHSHKGGGTIALAGHNIKLGRGGIREIEFFAQTQQLIYGGRDPQLRSSATVKALDALAAAGRIDQAAARDLAEAYRFLRTLEHRLQMIDDQQTHDLPKDPAGLAQVAAFMGYDGPGPFQETLLGHLRRVESAYAELFEQAPSLSGPGNLIFTGGEPEPGTLATLQALGFEDGTTVFQVVRAWHHGRYRATRSTRARQILTELMPTLLEALGKTPAPDAALVKFDEFLAGLPAGVQLFSLLHANPELLDLLARIMGGAPALAEHLSRRPGLLDAVLAPDFFDPVPPQAQLAEELGKALAQARDFQDVLDLSRRWANDRKFQAGTHILHHSASIEDSGRALSDIADSVIVTLAGPVLEEVATAHGRVPGAGLAVLALGKLGGREMTVSSDLDLIFIYEAEPSAETSNGAKPLPVSQYYGRLAQRFINALSALTAEGRLYEIDMRLRPSGKAGPIGVSLNAFRRYQESEAWTWEHMALTRARVVAGDPALAERIEAAIAQVLTAPRDAERLLVDVAAMRARIGREHQAASLWEVKYLRGGLVDLEFLAQYLQLRHAEAHSEVLDRSTQGAFAKLAEAGAIGASLAGRLIEATRLMRQVQGFLRLTVSGAFDEEAAPEGLKSALARAAGAADFAALKADLIGTAQAAHEAFVELVEAPAREAAARLPDSRDKNQN